VSTWIITVPDHTQRPNTPVHIETDHPEFALAYSQLPPQFKLYTLVNAMTWIGYRMTPGDTIETRKEQ
jgi:hypothetical protein